MSLSSLSRVVQLVDELQLLTAPQRKELEQDLKSRLAAPKMLAAELLRRGWITAYQANQLLQGNPRNLRLGPYVFLERLGEGGTGQVFKARHLHMSRIVALKIIRPELTVDAEVVSRFYREIQVISQLNHPNVIHAFDAGPQGSIHTLVMEYVEGLDLAKVVKQKGPLPAGQACDYVRQAACGLAHAHQKGLIHRDIKPSNLLIADCSGQSTGRNPQSAIVKVLDLGLARLQRTADGELTSTLTPVGSATMGTPDYLAPEQALNFHQVDIRADIYSLGCTLFFLLTGQPPFPGGSLAQKILRHQQADPPRLESMVPGLPPVLAAIVNRMLAKRPEDRYQAPAEVAAALAELAGALGSVEPVAPRAAGTVPDWTSETLAHTDGSAAALSPKTPRARYDVTVKQLVPAGATGTSLRPVRRRPFLAAGVAGLALLGVVLLGALLATVRGKPPISQKAAVTIDGNAVSLVRLDRIQGQVFLRKGEVRQSVGLGVEVRPGEQLELGAGSSARLNRGDRVFLDLGPGGGLVELPAEKGADDLAWRLKIEQSGTVQGEVRNSAGPLVLLGNFGEIKFSSPARFRFAASPDTNWLLVEQGSGELRQGSGLAAVRVPGGHYARFGPSASAVVQPLTAAVKVVDDFERQVSNWWPFDGTKENVRLTRRWVSPGKVDKQALRIDYDLGPAGTHAGVCFHIDPKQDWTRYRRLRFWFHGGQSNNVVQLWVWTQNGTQKWTFKDDFVGWRGMGPALSNFQQGNGKPSQSGLFRDVSQIDFRVQTSGKGSYQIDQLELLEHEILR